MTQTETLPSPGFSYLSDASPRDVKWDSRKIQSLGIAELYALTHYDKYTERMSVCSGWLGFALVSIKGTDELAFRLRDARFCRVRLCPICQWRRSLMWQAKFRRKLPQILADYPKCSFVLLTLTVKNCSLDELRATLAWMGESWKRLTLRKEFPAVGWVRNVEVTRGNDDSAHPHFHALLMVAPGYFSQGYISQKSWVQLWRSCLRVEYDPHVRVNAIRLKSYHRSLLMRRLEMADSSPDSLEMTDSRLESSVEQLSEVNENLAKAISYTFKYSVKPNEFLRDSDDPQVSSAWLIELTKQLHKTKAVALGGVFREYLREPKGENDEDLIHSQALPESQTDESDQRVYAAWTNAHGRYTMNA